tara:strand:+ start:1328 stop:1636 length:309 start_codon:yes stop_codon:yes gene_type:complete
MSEETQYKPLPSYLTIKKSNIHGLGLFCTEKIKKGFVIGITHVEDKRFENGYIRTPLGGFFNHSDNPNCEAFKFKDFIMLTSIKDIDEGDEITAKYWLYEIN